MTTLKLVASVAPNASRGENLTISIDDEELASLEPKCDAESCEADWPLDASQLKRILGGKYIVLTYETSSYRLPDPKML